jgi:branched-chain amino acid transport system substrate-binding protein
MKRTTYSILALIIIAALIMVTVGGEKRSDETITIGAIAPLTGGISVLGERMRNGMELARADLIEEGVVADLNIIYEDACLPADTVNAAQKLILQDNVDIIGSSFCLPGIDAIADIVEKENVILFNTAANPETVLSKDNIFSTNFAIPADATHIAKYAVEKLGAKRVAIVHFDSSYGESYYNSAKAYFDAHDVEVVAKVAKTLDATDFRTDVAKIKAAEPDVLLYFHFGSAFGTLVKQTREIGVDAPIIAHHEVEDPTVLEFAQGAAEGMIVSSSQPEVKTANVKAFEEKYLAAYGEMPDVLASNAYDSVRLQVESYVACAKDVTCTKEKLEAVQNYDGVSGRITIDPQTHAVAKPNIFKVVRDGAFVELK